MSMIYICYTASHLETQTVENTLPGFQGIKLCIQYIYSHPHKPIFYPVNYNGGSNVIIIKWSGNQFEDYTIQNCLEFYQYADHTRIPNRRRSVPGIIHTILGFSICCKVQFQPYVSSYSTDREITCVYKAVNKNKTIRRYMETLALHTGALTVNWE